MGEHLKLIRDILTSVLVWVAVVFFLTAIILIPNERPEIRYDLEYLERTEQYISDRRSLDWELYFDRIVDFFGTMIKEKSLGMTPYHKPVWDEFKHYASLSLKIVIPSILISFLLGVVKGIYDFRTIKRPMSLFGQRFTNLSLAIPDFFVVLGIQVIVIYLIKFGVLPWMSLYGNEMASHYFFAILFLTYYPTFYIAKITTTSLNEEAGYDYIRTAISKGTSERKVVTRHMLANVWLKVFSQFTTLVLYLLSNLFIVEYIMLWNGAAFKFYVSIADPRQMDPTLSFVFIIFFTGIVLIAQIISKIISFRILAKEGVKQ